MLNAEVVAGTVQNVKDATLWLGYTYLFIRYDFRLYLYFNTRGVTNDTAFIYELPSLKASFYVLSFIFQNGRYLKY